MCLRNKEEEDILYVTNGFYKPHYFELHLLTITNDDICDGNKLISTGNAFSTLCHEYIHYLQDILTLNGLVNINNYLCYMNNLLCTRQKQLTKIPNNSFSSQDIANWNKIKQSFGKKDPKTFDIRNIKSIDSDINENFIISFKDDSFFQIGTIHILEGMAALGQKIIKHAKKDNHYLNPYLIIYIITKNFYQAKIDDLLLFALCEVALTSNNPMLSFIQLLEICKDYKIDSLEKFQKFLITCDSFNSSKSTYNDFIDIVIGMMDKVFNDEMKEPREEFKTILNRCKQRQKDVILPITDFVQDMSSKPDTAFMKALSDIGEPNFFIKYKAFSFIKKTSDNGSLKYCAFRNIINNIDGVSQDCCDLKFCQHRDTKCDNQVHEKVLDDYGCAYCNIWKSYNLKI